MAYFGYLWLQLAPSMHWGIPLLRQCKHIKSSFKFSLGGLHTYSFNSAIFKFKLTVFNALCHYQGESIATGILPSFLGWEAGKLEALGHSPCLSGSSILVQASGPF